MNHLDFTAKAISSGDDALLLGAHDQAIAYYSTALSERLHAPPLPDEFVRHALCYRSDAWLGKSLRDRDTDGETTSALSAALADARKVVSLFPKMEDGWLRLGRAYLLHDNIDRAKHILRRATTYCNESNRVMDLLAEADKVSTSAKNGVKIGHGKHSDGHVGASNGASIFRRKTARGGAKQGASKTLDRLVPIRNSGTEARSTVVHDYDARESVASIGPALKLKRTVSDMSHAPETLARPLDSEDLTGLRSQLADLQHKEMQWKDVTSGDRHLHEESKPEDHDIGKRGDQEPLGATVGKKLLRQLNEDTCEESTGTEARLPIEARRLPKVQSGSLSQHEPLSEPSPRESPLNPSESMPPYPPQSDDEIGDAEMVGSGQEELDGAPPFDNSQEKNSNPIKGGVDDIGTRTTSGAGSNFGGVTSENGRPPQKLYDLLQVPHDATEAQIKKSYYMLARKYHPDKNADDVQATEQFQQLAEAYRVLSDPESRAVYNRYGDRGLVKNGVDVIDPSTLFAMVFGSDLFVHLIGELQLASMACSVDENGNTSTEQDLAEVQRSRIGKLVLEMVKQLKRWVDGDKKGFVDEVHQQMQSLRDASFGASLLHVVGNTYITQTAYLLDKTRPFLNLSAVMRKATMRSHKMAAQHKAMNAASKVMEKQRRLHDRVMRTGRDNRYISEDEAKGIAVEMAENAIDMMWKISVIDIETTLEDVLMIVLSGRDLVADVDSAVSGSVGGGERSLDSMQSGGGSGERERPRGRRRRLGSHLGKERFGKGRDGSGTKERAEAQGGGVGLVRPLAPLLHGEGAMTRQEILSERAYGIQAMGRIFMSAGR